MSNLSKVTYEAKDLRSILTFFFNMKNGETFDFQNKNGFFLNDVVFIKICESQSRPGTFKVIFLAGKNRIHQRVSGFLLTKKHIYLSKHQRRLLSLRRLLGGK